MEQDAHLGGDQPYFSVPETPECFQLAGHIGFCALHPPMQRGMTAEKPLDQRYICSKLSTSAVVEVAGRWRRCAGALLTLSKLHADSVAYYESTVGEWSGVDAYYSEDGRQPARAWMVGESVEDVREIEAACGVVVGETVEGGAVRNWFNNAVAPSGESLGRAPGSRGVPGYDLTFCAPKSASVLWGLSEDESVRAAVDAAHENAVARGLKYLQSHAGYTRKTDPANPAAMVLEKVVGLSGVRYEHRTSRAGDPHMHTHVLVSNKQLCRDGKFRTIDGVSLYHELRAAGMVYQAQLRAELTASLGVAWGEVINGCAEIAGLDEVRVLKDFSTRSREIDAWREANGVAADSEANPVRDAALARVGQKKTRQVKDVATPLSQLRQQWTVSEAGKRARNFIDSVQIGETNKCDAVMPNAADVMAAVTETRSTFTRADVVEAAAGLVPADVDRELLLERVEQLVDEIFTTGVAWSVTPERSREYNRAMREGSQRFTTESVVREVDRGIDLATAEVGRGVDGSSIVPVGGALSVSQASAMRTVVESDYRASVVIAPAGAGKTSSLKAARGAWELAGKRVVGLAPTGKAADVMVAESVAHESSTIARALHGTSELTAAESAEKVGWGRDTVVVVDEAGMVGTGDLVRVLEIAAAADARVVCVGDPHQYAAVRARSGLLGTLASELPDAVELTEVFRQQDAVERRVSQWLREGDRQLVAQAASWYGNAGRLHAGSVTAMLDDALAGWCADVDAGADSVLIAGDRDTVDALNRAAQKHGVATGLVQATGATARLNTSEHTQWGRVGDVVLTRRNDYDLVASNGEPVRNGQRWTIEDIHADGSVLVRRRDDRNVTVALPAEYVAEHVQLGYASTGHSAQGMTVDVARVVADASKVDRAGVYVPMTRGRVSNVLYLAESSPGDVDTAHTRVTASPQRRESVGYAEELLVAACARDRRDETPHQLWRDAYREWSLERLSSAYPVDDDPFVGTPMAEVMQDRRVARQQRIMRFAHRQDRPPVRDRAQRPLWAVPENVLQWAAEAEQPEVVAARREAAQAEHAAVTEHNGQASRIEQLDERKQAVSEEHQVVGQRLNEARGRLRQAQAAQQSRSRWAKLRGESFDGKIEQARGECESLEQAKAELNEQLVQIRQQRAACRYVTRPDYQDDVVTAERVELLDALATPEAIRAEQQDRARLSEAQQQAERAEAAVEFAGLRADAVWQDDEKHADGDASPGMPYMPSFDLDAVIHSRRAHGVPLPSPDADLDGQPWSPDHGADPGMDF